MSRFPALRDLRYSSSVNALSAEWDPEMWIEISPAGTLSSRELAGHGASVTRKGEKWAYEWDGEKYRPHYLTHIGFSSRHYYEFNRQPMKMLASEPLPHQYRAQQESDHEQRWTLL